MTDIFEQATQPTTPAPQGGDALTTKLAAITNEKGEPKYADVDTALDALKASQEFIPSLKNQVSEKDAEIAALRDQISKAQGVQETLERFTQQQTQPVAQPESQPAPQPDATAAVDVNSLVQAAFNAHQQQTVEAANLNEVNTALANQYGDKAAEHLTKRALELGTTPQALQDMAKSNPTMAMTLLNTEKPKVSMSYGGSNTAGFAQPQPAKLGRPDKPLMTGPTTGNEAADFMRQIRAEVYREHGVTV